MITSRATANWEENRAALDQVLNIKRENRTDTGTATPAPGPAQTISQGKLF